MRVRSSSAPTVRRRPNHRALSMARAAGSTKPARRSTSRGVKWWRVAVLDRQESDDRPACRAARRRGPTTSSGTCPGPPPARRFCSLTRLRRRRARAEGRREVVGGDDARRPGALAPERVPPQVGVVEHEERHRVELEQLPELIHRGVEHLVEVEGRRQRLGDLVQLEQEGVGVGEPARGGPWPGSGAGRPRRRCGGRSRRRGRRGAPPPTTAPRCGGRPPRRWARAPTGG